MRLLLIISAISFSLIASKSIFAEQNIRCPNPNSIKSIKFDRAKKNNINNKWDVGVASNNFDTDTKWSFQLQGIPATNENDAMTIASLGIKTLSYLAGPIMRVGEGYVYYICKYTTEVGFEGSTYTARIFD